jgi:hypothetical protein
MARSFVRSQLSTFPTPAQDFPLAAAAWATRRRVLSSLAVTQALYFLHSGPDRRHKRRARRLNRAPMRASRARRPSDAPIG